MSRCSFDNGKEDVPLWMSNEGVCACIPALLKCNCIAEERECLDAEEKDLMSWLKEEVGDIKEAHSKAAGIPLFSSH